MRSAAPTGRVGAPVWASAIAWKSAAFWAVSTTWMSKTGGTSSTARRRSTAIAATPSSGRTVDDTDRELLRLLATDGRLPHAELARRVNLSRPAVHHRLRRLEADGVIRGYRADLDWPAMGYQFTAFVLIRVIGPTAQATADAILGFQEPNAFVDECYRVAGDWSLLIRARASTTQTMGNLLDRVRALPNVNWSQTAVTLSALHETFSDS